MSLVRLLGHQTILSEQSFDDMRINELETHGLNYFWNTLCSRNIKEWGGIWKYANFKVNLNKGEEIYKSGVATNNSGFLCVKVMEF